MFFPPKKVFHSLLIVLLHYLNLPAFPNDSSSLMVDFNHHVTAYELSCQSPTHRGARVTNSDVHLSSPFYFLKGTRTAGSQTDLILGFHEQKKIREKDSFYSPIPFSSSIKRNTFPWPLSKKESFSPPSKLIYSVSYCNMHFVCAHIWDFNEKSYVAGKKNCQLRFSAT